MIEIIPYFYHRNFITNYFLIAGLNVDGENVITDVATDCGILVVRFMHEFIPHGAILVGVIFVAILVGVIFVGTIDVPPIFVDLVNDHCIGVGPIDG